MPTVMRLLSFYKTPITASFLDRQIENAGDVTAKLLPYPIVRFGSSTRTNENRSSESASVLNALDYMKIIFPLSVPIMNPFLVDFMVTICLNSGYVLFSKLIVSASSFNSLE